MINDVQKTWLIQFIMSFMGYQIFLTNLISIFKTTKMHMVNDSQILVNSVHYMVIRLF